MRAFIIVVVILIFASSRAVSEPPYSGTIFVDPDIITQRDESSFVGLEYRGLGTETAYDRRRGGAWVTDEFFIFDVAYHDKDGTRVRVNTEFSTPEKAEKEAIFYAEAVGRLPSILLRDLATITIHAGNEDYGGGNRDILIHTWRTRSYLADGILEETLFHEACHTSLDEYLYADPDWAEARHSDPEFISEYARDYPLREDVAESCLMAFAILNRPNRISSTTSRLISEAMPRRIAYFDKFVEFDNEAFAAIVSETDAEVESMPSLACVQGEAIGSLAGGYEVSMRIRNDTNSDLQISWLDWEAKRIQYHSLSAGTSVLQATFTKHRWVATNAAGECIAIVEPKEDGTWVIK